MGYKIVLEGRADSFMEELERDFKKAGHEVIEESEEVDIFVYCIHPPACEAMDYNALLKAYDETSLELLRKVSEYLPLLEKGRKKRLCFVTSLDSSINNTRTGEHWERIVSASCNMAVKTLFNRLNPLGFTFRLFAVEDYSELSEASYAAGYMLQDRSMEEESHQHSDEKRIVIRDKYEREYPW